MMSSIYGKLGKKNKLVKKIKHVRKDLEKEKMDEMEENGKKCDWKIFESESFYNFEK